MTAVADGAALERLGDRYRGGDLRELSSELGRHRNRVATRVSSRPSRSSTRTRSNSTRCPWCATVCPIEMYLHDFVAPQPGMQRVYEVQMREAFMKMLEMDALPMKTWGGFETVAGGGRVPQSLMVTWIADAPAISNLLSQGTRGCAGAGFVDGRGTQAARHLGLPPGPQPPVVAHELKRPGEPLPAGLSARGACGRRARTA